MKTKYEIRLNGKWELYCWDYLDSFWRIIEDRGYEEGEVGIFEEKYILPYMCVETNESVKIKNVIYGNDYLNPSFYYESRLEYYYNQEAQQGAGITGNAVEPLKPKVIPGDFNGDGKVNFKDIAVLSASFGSKCGDKNYLEIADLNKDCKINAKDMALFSKNYMTFLVLLRTWLSLI